MSSQATVHSVETLKDFRVALALYGDDTLAALGAIEAEVRRTVRWLQEDRPYYWQEQIKRRREQVSLAKSEVFRRELQKRPDYTPPMSEQKENLRRAEVSLQDAEKRLAMVRKWQPMLQHAVLEYHASVQRLKDLSAADVPSAVNLLSRLIDALEAYLRVEVPSGVGPEAATSRATPELESIATRILDEPAAVGEAPQPAGPVEARDERVDLAESARPIEDAESPLPPAGGSAAAQESV
jgi:hypothetical protein